MSQLNRRHALALVATLPVMTVPAAAVAIAAAVPPSLTDAHAALARAEQVIDALRTRVVDKGWKLDEDAASRALECYRRIANGSQDDDQEQGALAFFYDHGQSMDWIERGRSMA